MWTKISESYSSSPVDAQHEQGAVDVLNRFSTWMNGSNITSLVDMQAEWQEPGFNRATDTRMIVNAQGQVAGYADVWDITAFHIRMYSLFAVDPDQMGRGIEDELLGWCIWRAGENVRLAEEGQRVVLHISANSANQFMADLLARHGFRVARSSYRMRIDFDQPPAEPQAPDGIHIRPMIAGQEEREALRVAYDAFRDHWGAVDEPYEEYCKRWMYHMETDPNYDPAYYFVAMDGDQMAGVSLCYPRIEEVPDMAWVGTLGVRRDWRRRGLGQALLAYSFSEFYRRGAKSAGLGVDAENLTGATRLYERAGMRVWRKNNTYELELRPGLDLMKQH